MKHVKLRNHFMTAPLQCNELYIEAKIFSLFLFSEVGQCSSSSSFWACLLPHLSYTQAVKKKNPLSQTQLHFLEVKKQIIKSIMADKIICPWKKYHHVSFTMLLTLRTLSVIWWLFLYLPLWQMLHVTHAHNGWLWRRKHSVFNEGLQLVAPETQSSL